MRHRTLVALFGLLVGFTASGCGTGSRSRGGNYSDMAGGGDDGGGTGPCSDACPYDGATQCNGTLLQTCITGTSGCLTWDSPAACGTGMTCSMGSCIDVCTGDDIMTACQQAADLVNACCGGSGQSTDPITLCGDFIKAGKDPKQACQAWNLSTECSEVQAVFATANICCCPLGYACDPEAANKCVLTCSTHASCNNNPDGAYCALAGVNGVITQKARICHNDDQQPLHACDLISNGCNGGSECYRDRNNNNVCTKACTKNADCGNPGIACCDFTVKCAKLLGACSAAGGCMPCP